MLILLSKGILACADFLLTTNSPGVNIAGTVSLPLGLNISWPVAAYTTPPLAKLSAPCPWLLFLKISMMVLTPLAISSIFEFSNLIVVPLRASLKLLSFWADMSVAKSLSSRPNNLLDSDCNWLALLYCWIAAATAGSVSGFLKLFRTCCIIGLTPIPASLSIVSKTLALIPPVCSLSPRKGRISFINPSVSPRSLANAACAARIASKPLAPLLKASWYAFWAPMLLLIVLTLPFILFCNLPKARCMLSNSSGVLVTTFSNNPTFWALVCWASCILFSAEEATSVLLAISFNALIFSLSDMLVFFNSLLNLINWSVSLPAICDVASTVACWLRLCPSNLFILLKISVGDVGPPVCLRMSPSRLLIISITVTVLFNAFARVISESANRSTALRA